MGTGISAGWVGWVEIFGAGRVRVRTTGSISLATGTGRVAEMVDPHIPNSGPGCQRANVGARIFK